MASLIFEKAKLNNGRIMVWNFRLHLLGIITLQPLCDNNILLYQRMQLNLNQKNIYFNNGIGGVLEYFIITDAIWLEILLEREVLYSFIFTVYATILNKYIRTKDDFCIKK